MDIYRKRINELLEIKKKQPYFLDNFFGLKINVNYSVFPPDKGLFTSSILNYLKSKTSSYNSILDMGSGTGIIGLYMKSNNLAKLVTLCDNNIKSIECIKSNCLNNKLTVNIIHSDLFKNIPSQIFDLIVFNHPIFPSKIKVFRNELDGGFEIVNKFLNDAKPYINSSSLILMPFISTLEEKHNPYHIGLKLNYNVEILYSENNIMLIGLNK